MKPFKTNLRIAFFAIAVFSFCSASAQTLLHQPVKLGYENPDSVAARLTKYKAFMETKYDGKFKKPEHKTEFIESIIAYDSYSFESGSLFYKWTEAEDYLLAVAKKVIGDKIDNFTNVKVVRTPEDNAFMVEDGTIYLNVGLLANVRSEAELAATIGHEYGHYIKAHAYQSYLLARKNYWQQAAFSGTLLGLGLKSRNYADQREMEKEADEISLNLLINSPYNPYGFIREFERSDVMFRKYEKSAYYRHSFFNDHPSSKDRVSLAARKLQTIDTTGKPFYLVDQQMFQKLKQAATDESILLWLQQLDYDEAILLCYRELILHPTDEFYLFFINEALRRKLNAKPLDADDFFLSQHYTIYTKKKIDVKPVILSQKFKKISEINLKKQVYYTAGEMVFYDPKFNMDKMPVSSLSNGDTIEFISYGDAYEYFTALQKKLGYQSGNFTANMEAGFVADQPLPVSSEIPYLASYQNIFDTYKKYNLSTNNDKVNLLVYKISATKGKYKLNSIEEEDCLTPLLKYDVLKSYNRANDYNITEVMYDSLKHNDRNQFLLFSDAILTSYTAKPVYEQPFSFRAGAGVSAMGVNVNNSTKETAYAVDPFSLCPEMIPTIIKDQTRATVLLNVSLYYEPLHPMAQFAAKGALPAPGIRTSLIIHVLDYKRKRIIEKEMSIWCQDQESLNKTLLKAFPVINEMVNKSGN